jgi:hypothetical protein
MSNVTKQWVVHESSNYMSNVTKQWVVHESSNYMSNVTKQRVKVYLSRFWTSEYSEEKY